MPKRKTAPKRHRWFSDYDSGLESDSESQGESGQGLAQSPMQSDEEPGTPTHVLIGPRDPKRIGRRIRLLSGRLR